MLVYALLTYGNMPVQPRFRVKFLLKFKCENVVRLAFQKKFYSKTRMDGHITIREKSVFYRLGNSRISSFRNKVFNSPDLSEREAEYVSCV